ncbi:MAG: hypothetical protein IJX59_05375 [Clostridia bacterium]|nr:hypothetical protein [Clostridia bacterium]
MSFDFDTIIAWLEDVYQMLLLGSGILSTAIAAITTLITAVGWVVSLIAALIAGLVTLLIYILSALPVYRTARKAGRKRAWLAWVPFFGSLFRLYVLCDTAGQQPVTFFGGKLSFKRGNSFLVYLIIYFFGNALITAGISILSILPVLGTALGAVGTLLYLLPYVTCAFFEYAYLKDTLDLFKENQRSNRNLAILITVIDNLATQGVAKTICLYSLWSRKPLPKTEQDALPPKSEDSNAI